MQSSLKLAHYPLASELNLWTHSAMSFNFTRIQKSKFQMLSFWYNLHFNQSKLISIYFSAELLSAFQSNIDHWYFHSSCYHSYSFVHRYWAWMRYVLNGNQLIYWIDHFNPIISTFNVKIRRLPMEKLLMQFEFSSVWSSIWITFRCCVCLVIWSHRILMRSISHFTPVIGINSHWECKIHSYLCCKLLSYQFGFKDSWTLNALGVFSKRLFHFFSLHVINAYL